VNRDIKLTSPQQSHGLHPSPSHPSDSATTALSAPRRLGRYVIERQIGAGGMGEVYRAQDTRLERTVAIKVLPDRSADDGVLRRRFLNEARAASALNHPNIVALYDICTDCNVDFLVMEFVEGRTLRDLIADDPLSFERCARGRNRSPRHQALQHHGDRVASGQGARLRNRQGIG